MDERVSKRQAIKVKAGLRSGHGIAVQVNILDFSREGCRIEPAPRHIQRGDTISLRMGGIGPFFCAVRWSRTGQDAGLEFEYPLHAAIHDHLLRLWVGYKDPGDEQFEFHKLRGEIRLV